MHHNKWETIDKIQRADHTCTVQIPFSSQHNNNLTGVQFSSFCSITKTKLLLWEKESRVYHTTGNHFGESTVTIWRQHGVSFFYDSYATKNKCSCRDSTPFSRLTEEKRRLFRPHFLGFKGRSLECKNIRYIKSRLLSP